MNAICLLVAGVIQATLPATEFTLEWRHSIEKTRWIERYRIDGDALALIEASVEGNGAGMQSPPGAKLRNGAWVWQLHQRLPAVVLAASEFSDDYTLCAAGSCTALRKMQPSSPPGPVELHACPGAAAP
ncbi:MAG: DUF1850 domain-containing protein [Casimicrobiaceae bacterium]